MNVEYLERLDSISHLLRVVFSRAKDTKLLMQCILSLNDLYNEVLAYFEESVIASNARGDEILKAHGELLELANGYNEGPKSFRRSEDYIVCAKNYKVRIITDTSVEEYIALLSDFLLRVRD